ncbi:MAG: NAD(P)/FAD-dependent oxidoreductase [Pseudomonadota bacterium]
MTERAEVLVIGAGPAGLAAAAAAAQAGARILLLDEQPVPGGQVWRGADRRLQDPAAKRRAGDSDTGAAEALAGLDHPNIDYVANATIVDATPERRVSWIGPPNGGPRLREAQADALILATGAQERPVPFPGWTLPGVMGVGALQLLLKQGVVPEGRIVLAGQGPLILLTYVQLRRARASVKAFLDFGPALPPFDALRQAGGILADPALFAKGVALAAARAVSGTPVHRAVDRLAAHGTDRVERLTFGSRGLSRSIPCDVVAVHDGVIPNTQLTRLLNLPHVWDPAQEAFAPAAGPDHEAAPGIWVAGDGAGIGGAEIARLSGALAGAAAAASVGKPADGRMPNLRAELRRKRRARTFLDALYRPAPLAAHLTEDTPICRCEAVTSSQIGAAVQDGAHGPNRVKTFTRAGMGPCQGRMCGNTLTRVIADITAEAPHAVGALRIRPPLKPVLIEDYLPPDPDTEQALERAPAHDA